MIAQGLGVRGLYLDMGDSEKHTISVSLMN